MNKYYYAIPLGNKHISINGMSFDQMFGESHGVLGVLVDKKDQFFRLADSDYQEYSMYMQMIIHYCDSNNIPEYLMAVEEEGQIYGYLTHCPIQTDDYAEFETHEVPFDLLQEYCESSNYKERLRNLFEGFINDMEGKLIKRLK